MTSLTREKILDAFSKGITKKGFLGFSLGEIVREAGVTEPTFYQYFKGKEDLLYTVSKQIMETFLSLLNEHMHGISGVYDKLRKLIWVHLRYIDLNEKYMSIVLFECRTNPNFYKSEAYKLMHKYAGFMKSLLIEGVNDGIFRPDVDIGLIRDIIFGLIDFEAITSLVTHEIPGAVQDHEEIMQLVDRMLLTKYQAEIPPVEKRERILRAALQVFSKKGYSKSTISEIAMLASVAEGTVYEYFKNKEDLLFSIPEDRLQDHLDQLQKAFAIHDPERKLRLFIHNHFQFYLNDPDFCIVFLTLIQFNRRFYLSRANDSLRRYIQSFEMIVQEVIDNKMTGTKINIRIFRNMFLGAFTHMALRWFVVDHDRPGVIDKMGEIEEITRLLTHVFMTNSSTQ